MRNSDRTGITLIRVDFTDFKKLVIAGSSDVVNALMPDIKLHDTN